MLKPIPKEATPTDIFRHLCQVSCPHGYEASVYSRLLIAEGWSIDRFNNWHRYIPCAEGDSSSLFLSHLDTAGSIVVPIPHVVKDGIITSGSQTPIGADDRSGVTVLLWMSRKKVPGHYILTVGEERGCIGMSNLVQNAPALLGGALRAVSFDRYGRSSVITHQCGRRTCSDAFANALCVEAEKYGLAWNPDDTGVFTDSNECHNDIPECTNLSVGYVGHHSCKEVQDLEYLTLLCEAVLKIDWEGLPVARDPSEVGANPYESYWKGGWDLGGDVSREDGLHNDNGWEDHKSGKSRKYADWSEDNDPWLRVEMALQVGTAPDANDLHQIVVEDRDEALELLMYYLKGR